MLLYFKPTPTASDKLEYKKPPSKFLVKLAILFLKYTKIIKMPKTFKNMKAGIKVADQSQTVTYNFV